MRMLDLIASCKGCPHNKYDSGGRYKCDLVDEPIRDENRIPPFCPLPTYPSNEIACIEATVESMQKEKRNHSLCFEIFSFMAAKLKARLSSDSRYIHILMQEGKNEEDLYIVIDRITKVDIERNAIYFLSTGNDPRPYVMYLGLEPLLCEVSERQGKEMTTQISFRIPAQ